jgi:hypothetical protein
LQSEGARRQSCWLSGNNAIAGCGGGVWATDFLDFPCGYRPGRSAHMALDALAMGIQTRKVSYVLDADIRGFFDTPDADSGPGTARLTRQTICGGLLGQCDWQRLLEIIERSGRGQSGKDLGHLSCFEQLPDLGYDAIRLRAEFGLQRCLD